MPMNTCMFSATLGATLLLIACTSGTAAAQSGIKGRVLISEDFSSSTVDRKNFPNTIKG